jgi:phosphoribosylglycinamide formyltransferase-1
LERALRLGVLVSGRGTNLQALLDAIARGELRAGVALVACNRQGAGAIDRAERAGVPVELFTQREYGTREGQQAAIADRLEALGVDLVVCAGWDRIFTADFVRRFPGRIINVHPSLLPAFGGGLHAVRDALEYGVKITGCTVHFVTDELDSGPVISQAAVAVRPDDTEETLAERIHFEEHRLLVEAIGLYAQGKLEIAGRTVRVKGDDH